MLCVWLVLSALRGAAQAGSFEQLLAAGKAEFGKAHPTQNYRAAAAALEAAVRLQPRSAEAHYFLGYAYSRVSSRDGDSLTYTRAYWTQKASQALETVNRLTPRYPGEQLALDPYCKLSSVWGAQALAYQARQLPDSARWALREGKKRGGFSDFTLRYARALLDECGRDGILVSSGDLNDFALWYVQWLEGYRRDVTVVDIGLLNSRWYAPFLQASTALRFDDLRKLASDSTFYIPWETALVSIPNARTQRPLEWLVHPSVDSAYLQRSDDLLLQLLLQNEFRRAVYFTPGFPPDQQLGLRPYAELRPLLLLHQLNADQEADPSLAEYLAGMNRVLPMLSGVNPNSRSETDLVGLIRYGVLLRLDQADMHGRRAELKPLVALIDRYFPPSKYPFEGSDLQQLYEKGKRGQ